MRLIGKWRHIRRKAAVRTGLLLLGWLLIVATPFVAVIPGPGGIFVFAAGLALLLRNSAWARRAYVRFKRRWPRYGEWADRGLRRRSERRRRLRRAGHHHALATGVTAAHARELRDRQPRVAHAEND